MRKDFVTFCADSNETIRVLRTICDVFSRVRLIVHEPSFQNHIIRHRMARHMYNLCICKVQGHEQPVHSIERNLIAVEGTKKGAEVESEVLVELEKLRATVDFEVEFAFEIETPFSWDKENIAVISWDCARHLSISRIVLEITDDHFAYTLSYNV